MFDKRKKEDVPAFYELSLKKVIISGETYGKFGEFTIEQIFVNNKTSPLEVSYTFPITETSVVTGFQVQVGEKVMHGICKKSEDAKKEYIENLEKGNSAYLLNQDTGNVFDVMVGKVLPNEEVHIKISYLDFYDVVDNGIRLIIPTLVNQRYKSELTDGLNYGKVDYTVDFNIKIHKVLNYTQIESVNHKINKNDSENIVEITAENYDMSKDFVLDMKFEDAQISNAFASHTKDGKEALLLSFMPEIDEYEDSEKEYIFIVDTSGSMSSSNKMEKTKEALKRCLKELDEGDKFNIIPFDNRFSFFKAESIDVTEKNIKEATKYVDDLRASGGTEILKPIQFALYEKSDDKVIIVLTDGEVGNEGEIVDFIAKNIYNSKLFVFGIDTSVNTSFIKDMAKAGNGKAEFIYPNEQMDDAIVRTFARIQSPLVKDIKIDYGTSHVINEIKQDSALFNYEFFQAVALVDKLPEAITLKGKVGEKELSWGIRTINIHTVDNNSIALMYAKKQIDLYEELIRSYERDYRNQRAGELIKEYKEKIAQISIENNIASKYTSFISVNERDEKVFEPSRFENVTLSNAEMDIQADMCMSVSRASGAAPSGGRGRKFFGKATGSFFDKLSYKAIDPMPDWDNEASDNDGKDIIVEAFEDLSDIKLNTFLLGVIYLSDKLSEEELEKMFKKYINEHAQYVKDQPAQELLLYMYQNMIFSNYILDNLLIGVYKKIAITGADYELNLDNIDFGEDHSRKLSNGNTLKAELINRLDESMRRW